MGSGQAGDNRASSNGILHDCHTRDSLQYVHSVYSATIAFY